MAITTCSFTIVYTETSCGEDLIRPHVKSPFVDMQGIVAGLWRNNCDKQQNTNIRRSCGECDDLIELQMKLQNYADLILFTSINNKILTSEEAVVMSL